MDDSKPKTGTTQKANSKSLRPAVVAVKLTLLLYAILGTGYVFVCMSEAFDTEVEILRRVGQDSPRELEGLLDELRTYEATQGLGDTNGTEGSRIFPYNWFVGVEVSAWVKQPKDWGLTPPPPSVSLPFEETLTVVDTKIRWDRVAIVVALAVMVLLAYTVLYKQSPIPPHAEPATNGEFPEAEAVLQQELSKAHGQARDLYSRSTLLLAGGILMAFVGITIFSTNLPEHTPGEKFEDYAAKALRPAGMLVFIEAVAWFLLRQYRNLIEDFKWFHRVYLKRANYLAAYKLVESEDVKNETLFLAASLLEEDLSGKLGEGESTESLEAQKSRSDNPIFALVQKIIDTQKS